MAARPSAEDAAARAPVAGDRARTALAPALLVALALGQAALVVGQDLTAWKGGGFGMFSTLDHEGWRTVRLYAEEPGLGEPRRVPLLPALRREARRARILPSRASLRALARAAFTVHPRASAVRVEVHRTRFDEEGLQPHTQPLAALRVEREPRR